MGGVYVELRASSPNVRIERVIGQLRVPVCYAPCRLVLPRSNVYVIGGNGVQPSSQFVLPDDRPQVTLDVQAGSSARMAGGGILAGVGLLTAYAGLIILAANDARNPPTTFTQDGTRPPSTGTGTVLLLGGLTVGVVGLYMALGTHTIVRSSTGSVFTESPRRALKPPAIAFTSRGLEF
jgi:hypothetical protein